MRDYKVYEKDSFIILMIKGKYIVFNQNKEFKDGHTHLKSFKMAKIIIDYCIEKRVPNVTNDYLLISALRITDDEEYKRKIEDVLKIRRERDRNRYYNVNKGVKI